MRRAYNLLFFWGLVLVPVCTHELSRAQTPSSDERQPLLGVQTGSPAVSLSASSLNFNTVTVGLGATLPLVVTNTGTAPLILSSIAISGAVSGNFTETSNCGLAIAPNMSCTVWVTATPALAGTATASLVITDNAASATQTVALNQTAAGTGLLSISLSTSNITFASQDVGTRSWPMAITMTNTTGVAAALTGMSFASTSEDFSETSSCGATLAASPLAQSTWSLLRPCLGSGQQL